MPNNKKKNPHAVALGSLGGKAGSRADKRRAINIRWQRARAARRKA